MINKNTKRKYYILFFIEFIVVLILSIFFFLFVLKSYPGLFINSYQIVNCIQPGSYKLDLVDICIKGIRWSRSLVGFIGLISLFMGALTGLVNYYIFSKRNPRLLKTSLAIALISFFVLIILMTLALYLDLIS